MNRKTLSLGVFGFLALALMISFASATITISDSTPLNPSVYGNTFNVTLTTDNSSGEQVTAMTFSQLSDGVNSIIFTAPTTPFAVPTGSGIIVPITYNTNNFNFNYVKTYSTTLSVTGNISDTSTKTITFAQKPFCDNVTNVGSLTAEITDVKTITGFGDNDNYWYPLDQVQIEVTVDNQGSWDVRNIEVTWELYAADGTKISDDKLSTFKLNSGDDKVVTFTITLDKKIKDFDGQNAVLLVKAKGKVSDSNAGSNNNQDTCNSDSKTVDVITDDNFVILKNILLNNEGVNNDLSLNSTLTCGEEVNINANAWNIQNSDENGVSVEVYNKELGIDQTISVGDINSFSKEVLNSQITIPNNAAEKWYNLLFTVYNEDHNIYENSNNQLSEYSVKVKVVNCTSKLVPSLSAQLGSEAIAGKELVISAVITNKGTSAVTYTLNAAGYADWATLKNMSATSITLNAGEAKTVQIIFDTTKASAGDRFFNLEVVANNQLVASQPVAVTIASKNGSGFSNFVTTNWKLLGIILLNLILVIAIIVVIVRLYRK